VERYENISHILIGIPDTVPKKTWRKRKDHGKANTLDLIAAEESGKD
jgi:hypothetical protein